MNQYSLSPIVLKNIKEKEAEMIALEKMIAGAKAEGEE